MDRDASPPRTKPVGFHQRFVGEVAQKPKYVGSANYTQNIRLTEAVKKYKLANKSFVFPSVRTSHGNNDICRKCGKWCTQQRDDNSFGEYHCLIGHYRRAFPERARVREADPMQQDTASYPYPFFCNDCFGQHFSKQADGGEAWVLGKLFDVSHVLVVNRDWTFRVEHKLKLFAPPPSIKAIVATAPRRLLYAAGKITNTEWRRTERMPYDPDQIHDYRHPNYMETDLTYVGPYPIACDHKCWHTVPHAAANAVPGDVGDCAGNDDIKLTLSDVVENSQSQIRACEIFYARLDVVDCFGTFSEIGYAAALKKPIYLDIDPTLETAHEWWFLAQQALRSPLCESDIKRIPLWAYFKLDEDAPTGTLDQYRNYLQNVAAPKAVYIDYEKEEGEE
jgi:hypothetical protein